MALADFFFSPLHDLNLCFPWDVVFQIYFLFCTCCFRLVKCSWIMLVYFHNFVYEKKVAERHFLRMEADMFGRWDQTDGVRRIFVLRKNNQGCAFPAIHSSQAPLEKVQFACSFIKFFWCHINSSKEGNMSSFFLYYYFNTELPFCAKFDFSL